MHTEILTATQLAVLEALTAVPAIREFYLAGGTALALRHGHRRSIDFDFFRETPFDVQGLLLGLELFERKYGTRRTERYLRLRALTYFDDAECEPMPDMLVQTDWQEVRRFFTSEAARLLAAGTD